MRVLVVEDNPKLRPLVARALRTQGYIESSTAAVQGSFAGFDVPPGAFAFTGRSHAVTVELTRDTSRGP